MAPYPSPSLLDLILAGGALGLCNLFLLLVGMPISILLIVLAKRRRPAIVVPAVCAGLTFVIGVAALTLGYVQLNAHLTALGAAGEIVSQAEIDDSLALIWFTTGQNALVCVAFACVLVAAIFLKRDRRPEATLPEPGTEPH